MATKCGWRGCKNTAEYLATQKVGKRGTLACCEAHRPGADDLSRLTEAQRELLARISGPLDVAPTGRDYDLRFYSVRYIGDE